MKPATLAVLFTILAVALASPRGAAGQTAVTPTATAGHTVTPIPPPPRTLSPSPMPTATQSPTPQLPNAEILLRKMNRAVAARKTYHENSFSVSIIPGLLRAKTWTFSEQSANGSRARFVSVSRSIRFLAGRRVVSTERSEAVISGQRLAVRIGHAKWLCPGGNGGVYGVVEGQSGSSPAPGELSSLLTLRAQYWHGKAVWVVRLSDRFPESSARITHYQNTMYISRHTFLLLHDNDWYAETAAGKIVSEVWTSTNRTRYGEPLHLAWPTACARQGYNTAHFS